MKRSQIKANPEKVREWQQRSRKPLQGQKLPQVKRKTTKAAKLRRKRGEWSTATADKLFSLYIRQRDGKCRRCGITEFLTCSHYHIRGKSATRFDPKNCIALCAGPMSNRCHETWEGQKNGYTEFMLNWLGQEEFIALSIRAGTFMERKAAVKECKKLLNG